MQKSGNLPRPASTCLDKEEAQLQTSAQHSLLDGRFPRASTLPSHRLESSSLDLHAADFTNSRTRYEHFGPRSAAEDVWCLLGNRSLQILRLASKT
eukprot:6191422-Pleurochrysis_carterae.AAC.1